MEPKQAIWDLAQRQQRTSDETTDTDGAGKGFAAVTGAVEPI
jgi:hypothetical protein